MPTKLNKGGKQQPYIPEGNGDASGEYADGEGYNRNKPMKKEDSLGEVKSEPVKSVIEPEAKPTEGEKQKLDGMGIDKKTKEEVAQSIKDKIKSKTLGKVVDNWLKNGDEESNRIVDKYLQGVEATKRKTEFFRPSDGNLYLKSSSTADTFYHESGHAIDYFAVKDLPNENEGFTIKKYASCSYKSEKHGVTLKQAIIDTFKENPYLYSSARDYYDETKQKKLNEKASVYGYDFNGLKERQGFERNRERDINQEVRDKYKQELNMLDEEKNRIFTDYFVYGKITRDDYNAQVAPINDKIDRLETDMFNEIKARCDAEGLNLTNIVFKVEKEVGEEMDKAFADLGDVFSGAGYGFTFGWGHSKAYWTNSDYLRGTEFFAEAFSAKSSNKESYEVLKTFFPKPIEIFEEIYKKVGR